jgi:hypothetical protein
MLRVAALTEEGRITFHANTMIKEIMARLCNKKCNLCETPQKMTTGIKKMALRRRLHSFEAKSLAKQARFVLMI